MLFPLLPLQQIPFLVPCSPTHMLGPPLPLQSMIKIHQVWVLQGARQGDVGPLYPVVMKAEPGSKIIQKKIKATGDGAFLISAPMKGEEEVGLKDYDHHQDGDSYLHDCSLAGLLAPQNPFQEILSTSLHERLLFLFLLPDSHVLATVLALFPAFFLLVLVFFYAHIVMVAMLMSLVVMAVMVVATMMIDMVSVLTRICIEECEARAGRGDEH